MAEIKDWTAFPWFRYVSGNSNTKTYVDARFIIECDVPISFMTLEVYSNMSETLGYTVIIPSDYIYVAVEKDKYKLSSGLIRLRALKDNLWTEHDGAIYNETTHTAEPTVIARLNPNENETYEYSVTKYSEDNKYIYYKCRMETMYDIGNYVFTYHFRTGGWNTYQCNPFGLYSSLYGYDNIEKFILDIQENLPNHRTIYLPNLEWTPDDATETNYNGENDTDIEETPLLIPDTLTTDIKGSNYYLINKSIFQNFLSWLWNDIIKEDNFAEWFINSITGINGNLANNIISATLYPFDFNALFDLYENDNIVLGRFNSNLTVTTAKNTKMYVDLCKEKIEKKLNNFLDYDGYTELYLYLPYKGFISLDVNRYMGRTLSVKLVIDIATGTGQYLIYCDNALVENVFTELGVQIPLTLSDGAEFFRKSIDIVSSVGDITKNATSGSVIGTLSSAGDMINKQYDSVVNTQAGHGNSLFYMPNYCFLVRKYPTYNRPKNYGKYIGYPLRKTYKLTELKGFTVIENPIIENFNGTQNEYDEITTLLKEGVIL